MTITFANLGVNATPDTAISTDLASYATASWSPPTTGIILISIINRNAAGNNTVVSVTGNSLTWTQIATVTFSAGQDRISIFAAPAAGATTGATTIDYGANTQLMCRVSFAHVTGLDLSGAIAAAFVQAPTGTGVAATSSSITLSAAGHADNRPYAVFVHLVNEPTVPRTNWTELDDLGGASPVATIQTQFRSDAFETTASASWATSTAWAGIAIEIKADLGVAADDFQAQSIQIGELHSEAKLPVGGAGLVFLMERIRWQQLRTLVQAVMGEGFWLRCNRFERESARYRSLTDSGPRA